MTLISKQDRAARWLIEPAAAPEDPAWQGRDIWQLLVKAPNAAFARVAAENWAQPENPVPAGNMSALNNAGFTDQKLYRVRELPHNEGPALAEFEAEPVMVLAGPMPSRARA
jgi:uncharacterized membrane-anchored protein